jgi:hypothetical protein
MMPARAPVETPALSAWSGAASGGTYEGEEVPVVVLLAVPEGVGVRVAETGEGVREGVAVGEHDATTRGVLAPRSGVAKSERYSVLPGAVRASEAVRLSSAFSAML